LIVAAQQNSIPVLYSYCNLFFCTWCSQRIGISQCAFVWRIACDFVWKSRGFFFWLESGKPWF